MKIHTPIFILGLLVFITPIIGLPEFYEQIIFAIYGIAIMVLVASVKFLSNSKKTKTENSSEVFSENKTGDDQ